MNINAIKNPLNKIVLDNKLLKQITRNAFLYSYTILDMEISMRSVHGLSGGVLSV